MSAATMSASEAATGMVTRWKRPRQRCIGVSEVAAGCGSKREQKGGGGTAQGIDRSEVAVGRRSGSKEAAAAWQRGGSNLEQRVGGDN